jgi:hypothetical protein
MGDKVGTADAFFVSLITPDGERTPPRFPCGACGKETKEHHPEERTLSDGATALVPRRICSSPTCRAVSYAKS